jgi:citrate lyase subunit beta/citryl-CoA lyase
MPLHPSIDLSYLFVPATRLDRIDKARGSGAHAVIVDLEDAISVDTKIEARHALQRMLRPTHPVIVRINGVGTPWFDDDLSLCRHDGVAAVMLPKAEDAADLQMVHAVCGRPVIALVETARGVSNVTAVARAPGVMRLAFGAIDFRLDLGLPVSDYHQLDVYRAGLVIASRVARLSPPVDGPTTVVDDPELVRTEALAARRLGFGAKLCIHPAQVDAVNEAFSPTSEEIQWAQRVVEAFDAARGGVVTLDRKMIDVPVVEMARRVLASSERQ